MNAKKKIGWDSRPRTMLRNIQPGDVFVFKIDEGKFGVGRILTKVDFGNVAEFFNAILDSPNLNVEDVIASGRRGRPVVLDSYGLFDKKIEGDWRIVDHVSSTELGDAANFYFSYGAGSNYKKVDIFGNETSISSAEAANFPHYGPKGDLHVKRDVFGIKK